MEGTLKSFIIDGSETSVQNIVSKLKFLAKYPKNMKLDVATLTLQEDNLITSLYRTLIARSESRNQTLSFFAEIIGEGFDLASNYLKRDDCFCKDVGEMIITAIQESKAGLLNLAEKYKTDRMFVSKVETLMSTLDTKIKDLQRQVREFEEKHKKDSRSLSSSSRSRLH